MTEPQLRDMRSHVMSTTGDRHARDLILELIDLYLSVGSDPQERASAAASCLQALEEAERNAPAVKPSKAGGCMTMIVLCGVAIAGLLAIC